VRSSSHRPRRRTCLSGAKISDHLGQEPPWDPFVRPTKRHRGHNPWLGIRRITPSSAQFIDAEKTAGELYGRALMVIAAEQHATRLVVPASQRMPATRWRSHTDIAGKAFKKLAPRR
jgi:hypothetical protein